MLVSLGALCCYRYPGLLPQPAPSRRLLDCFFEGFDHIGLFPRPLLTPHTAEMPIRGSVPVDRLSEVKPIDNALRGEIEDLLDGIADTHIAVFASPEGIHAN